MLGEKGHICIDTRDMERALAYYNAKVLKSTPNTVSMTIKAS